MGRGAVEEGLRWLGNELMRNMPSPCPQHMLVLAGGKYVLLLWFVLQSCCWQRFLPIDGVS